MENEVWSEISAFLNNLRCGDVSRKSYLHFPELEEAEKIRKVKKANFETEMRKLNAEQRQQILSYIKQDLRMKLETQKKDSGSHQVLETK